jgi:ribonuclease T1
MTGRGRSVGAAVATVLLALFGAWLVQGQSSPAGNERPSARPGVASPRAQPSAVEVTTSVSPAPTPADGIPVVDHADLPEEAHRTIALIGSGGPFPYEQDGDVFGNREQLLPLHAYGYYREYTVDTPGSDDRGARRIVAGSSGELYYTDDHYESFRRVRR